MKTDFEKNISRISDYLKISIDSSVGAKLEAGGLSGRLGDKTGTKKYGKLTPSSVDSWKKTLCNPLRKWWVGRYLRQIDGELFHAIGYDKGLLLGELNEVKPGVKFLISDVVRMTYGHLYSTARRYFYSKKI